MLYFFKLFRTQISKKKCKSGKFLKSSKSSLLSQKLRVENAVTLFLHRAPVKQLIKLAEMDDFHVQSVFRESRFWKHHSSKSLLLKLDLVFSEFDFGNAQNVNSENAVFEYLHHWKRNFESTRNETYEIIHFCTQDWRGKCINILLRVIYICPCWTNCASSRTKLHLGKMITPESWTSCGDTWRGWRPRNYGRETCEI